MTLPLLGLARDYGIYCGIPDPRMDSRTGKMNSGIIVPATLQLLDTCVSITAVVLGILGALSIIAMPAALAYSLIGLSAAITALWIVGAIKTQGNLLLPLPDALLYSMGCKDKKDYRY